jgi:hypothetical protein
MAKDIELKGKARSDEIVKCGQDPIYFMKRYVYISHPDRGLIKFDTFPFQDECVKDFESHRFNIVLKSRQLGLSTVAAAYCLWFALFQRQKNVLVIATRLDVAKNFLRKVRQMFDGLPKWLIMPTLKEDSVRYLNFTNGSRITAIPTGDDAGRSEAVSLLIVDEAAHIDKFDYHWTGLYSTVTHSGRAIILSTPKGVGNKFHELWMGCDLKKKENDFHGIELPWNVHPEHDQAWFDHQCKNLDKRGIAQELLCDFQASGQTYISPPEIQWLTDSIKPPIAKFELDPNVWIWKYPITGRKYVMSADVARGDGDDYSTFHILDTEDNEVVAEYQGKRPPDRFGELMVEVGQRYNNALICNEKNSFGLATSYKLRDLKYPNLYYEKFAKGGPYQQIYNPLDVEGESPGFTTSSKNRIQILSKLEQAVRNKSVKIYSSRFAEEVKTLIWKETRAQAQKGYNDDLVISLAILCFIFELGDNVSMDNTAVNNAMVRAWSKSSTNYTSTGYSNMAASVIGQQDSMATGFQRSSMGNGLKPGMITPEGFVQVPAGQVPAGVDKAQLESALSIYNMYNWLLK